MHKMHLSSEPFQRLPCRMLVCLLVTALDGEVVVKLCYLCEKLLLFVFRLLAFSIRVAAVGEQRSTLLKDEVNLSAFGRVSIVLHTQLI